MSVFVSGGRLISTYIRSLMEINGGSTRLDGLVNLILKLFSQRLGRHFWKWFSMLSDFVFTLLGCASWASIPNVFVKFASISDGCSLFPFPYFSPSTIVRVIISHSVGQLTPPGLTCLIVWTSMCRICEYRIALRDLEDIHHFGGLDEVDSCYEVTTGCSTSLIWFQFSLGSWAFCWEYNWNGSPVWDWGWRLFPHVMHVIRGMFMLVCL